VEAASEIRFLDFTTAPVAEAASIDAERVRGLFALDLRGLTFMDPTGPRVIVVASQRPREIRVA